MVLKTEGFACVYWIHTAEQKDEFTQGYIGVSKNPNKRWIQHKTDANCDRHSNQYLSNAINKYGNDLIYEVIFGGTEQQCFDYELKLRPTPSIGWNLMSGGPVGKITEEGRKKLSESKKGKTLTPYKKETIRYNNYTKKNGYVTRKQFLDIEAIIKEQVPPSVINMEVFSILQNEVYSSIKAACEQNPDYSEFDMYKECITNTGNWIFLKNLLD